ncbi:hypothetical protein [Paraburkholderia sp. UCT70]|uniref:hypothetical protein n=1 Tax=Paraburkholderia sp. UCT70 TaxID=2991068 RepID=UPI003D24494B
MSISFPGSGLFVNVAKVPALWASNSASLIRTLCKLNRDDKPNPIFARLALWSQKSLCPEPCRDPDGGIEPKRVACLVSGKWADLQQTQWTLTGG